MDPIPIHLQNVTTSTYLMDFRLILNSTLILLFLLLRKANTPNKSENSSTSLLFPAAPKLF